MSCQESKCLSANPSLKLSRFSYGRLPYLDGFPFMASSRAGQDTSNILVFPNTPSHHTCLSTPETEAFLHGSKHSLCFGKQSQISPQSPGLKAVAGLWFLQKSLAACLLFLPIPTVQLLFTQFHTNYQSIYCIPVLPCSSSLKINSPLSIYLAGVLFAYNNRVVIKHISCNIIWYFIVCISFVLLINPGK